MLQKLHLFFAIRSFQDHSWVVSITVFVLVLLVIIKWTKSNYFFYFLNSLFSSVFYSKKFAEKRRIEGPEVLLFIASLLGISFFVFLLLFGNDFSILIYLQVLFLIVIFLLSKYLIEKMIGDLFQLDQLISKYLFFKQGILSWIGVFFLFPISLVFYFQDVDNNLLFIITAGIAVVTYVFKLFSFFALYQKHILSYWFYFILYLCSFEIAPYLILFKLIRIN